MPSLANKTTVVVTALVFVCILGYKTAVGQVPTPAHVIVVIEENHGYSQIIGSSQAPYINTLASQGALFTNSSALTHPSQPNYLDLFSGSDQRVTNDSCPPNDPLIIILMPEEADSLALKSQEAARQYEQDLMKDLMQQKR